GETTRGFSPRIAPACQSTCWTGPPCSRATLPVIAPSLTEKNPSPDGFQPLSVFPSNIDFQPLLACAVSLRACANSSAIKLLRRNKTDMEKQKKAFLMAGINVLLFQTVIGLILLFNHSTVPGRQLKKFLRHSDARSPG